MSRNESEYRKVLRSPDYRRVLEDEDDDLDHQTIGSNNSPCLLPCLLVLLIMLSLSGALAFFFLNPRHKDLQGDLLGELPSLIGGNGNGTAQDSHNHTRNATQLTETEKHPNNPTMTPEGPGLIPEAQTPNKTNTTVLAPQKNATTNGTVLGLNVTSELQSEKEKFILSIRKFTAYVESVTGVEGELLLPLCMLIVFLTSIAVVSCCCCLLARRRERRRRELFGKIITDLQTGDSKRVLLHHSDADE